VEGPIEPGLPLVCGPFKALNKELESGLLLDVKEEASMMSEKEP